MATRKAYIDAAKFLGIFIVLMNHIELILPFVNFYGGMFYVPVFFVAAGMTYYNKKEEGLRVFMLKKAKRLLVPYFVCNGLLYLFFLVKDIITGAGFHHTQLMALFGILYSRNSLYIPGCEPNVYFMTILNSPTWFLTGMFLTYLLVKISFFITKGEKKALALFLACMLLFGIILHYFCPVLLPWSLESVPLFYCYMMGGYFIREEQLFEKKNILSLILLTGTPLFGLTCYVNGSANISVGLWGNSVILGLFNGLFSSFFILWLCKFLETCLSGKVIHLMAWIGNHTLSILCYHMFVFAMIKAALFAVFPLRMEEGTWVSRCIKLGILLFTIGVIAGTEELLKRMAHSRKKQ